MFKLAPRRAARLLVPSQQPSLPPSFPPCSEQELDKHDAVHRDWWSALTLVVEHELYEEQKREDIDRAK